MKGVAVLALATLLLALFFQCCPCSSSVAPAVEDPTDQPAAPPSEPPVNPAAARLLGH